ncbi:hypothetical protein E1295_10215 [Nonomuraea mesophila]|uniref:Saccharopine dehydrogenase NADP binding domain-containing protein n=1 Tax=Nonomuraea mesophila TaxID=2530382 RepID=A0A4R5FU38_9ACTN|nr:hypothetical protein E1295_10215 [Nonomuraea mesophila]
MIGVAGVTGTVGRRAVSVLAGLGAGPLRLGGRRPAELERIAATLPDASVHRLDLDDPESMDRFCSGCHTVLNCAGPSYLILDALARAALRGGADYVDVSGDEPVHERLSVLGLASRRAVLSAGVLPGLSGLIPRWMAAGFDRVDALTTYIGGLERCSPGSATDMILSMRGDSGDHYGQALAGWRNGKIEVGVLRPVTDVELPFFPDRVTLQPFFGGESERLASAIGAASMDFWNVFAGDRLLSAFTGMRGRPPWTDEEMEAAVAELTRAADLDMFGRLPYYALLFRMAGDVAGRHSVRTVALRTEEAYRLIAVVAGLTTHAVAEGRIPPGVHYAADVLDPETVIDGVRHSGALAAFEVIDDLDMGADLMDEGAL